MSWLDWWRKNQETLSAAGTWTVKLMLIGVVIGSMALAGMAADPGRQAAFTDRILVWSFAVFAVGTADLFVLFVVLSILGIIDLPRAFEDKDPSAPPVKDKDGKTSSVSLSRLQAFMWTLILMIVYFHRVVSTDSDSPLPVMPPELLMLMGLSSAVYLTSKQMAQKAGAAKETSPAKDPTQGSVP